MAIDTGISVRELMDVDGLFDACLIVQQIRKEQQAKADAMRKARGG